MSLKRSTLQQVKSAIKAEKISLDAAIYRIEKALYRKRVEIQNQRIKISGVKFPLGNKAWGMIEYLERNGYQLIDFSKYQTSMFGEDQFNFYPHKRKLNKKYGR